MLELVQHFSSYSAVVIFLAAILDIFFLTGLILYGAAMIGSIAAMYTTGLISLEMIAVSSYLGTVIGNTINFGAGKLFKEAPFIAKKLEQKNFQTAKKALQNRSLSIFMIISRFIALVRPLYALLLGSLDISFRRFIFYESIIAFFWVIFWMVVIIKGGEIFLELINI